jgi:cyclic pyranopterin phosphate synthase
MFIYLYLRDHQLIGLTLLVNGIVVRLPNTCIPCVFNNDRDCHEGFYGLQLYKDYQRNFQVGVCIQRMDLCQQVDEFLKSDRAIEIEKFKLIEYN